MIMIALFSGSSSITLTFTSACSVWQPRLLDLLRSSKLVASDSPLIIHSGLAHGSSHQFHLSGQSLLLNRVLVSIKFRGNRRSLQDRVGYNNRTTIECDNPNHPQSYADDRWMLNETSSIILISGR